MSDRKFNIGRLYKLTKVTIISISVLLFLLSLPGLRFFPTFSNYSIKWVDSLCKDSPYAFCKVAAWSTVTDIQNSTLRMLGIAFVLPVLFFGGARLYKYLFPIKEKD